MQIVTASEEAQLVVEEKGWRWRWEQSEQKRELAVWIGREDRNEPQVPGEPYPRTSPCFPQSIFACVADVGAVIAPGLVACITSARSGRPNVLAQAHFDFECRSGAEADDDSGGADDEKVAFAVVSHGMANSGRCLNRMKIHSFQVTVFALYQILTIESLCGFSQHLAV